MFILASGSSSRAALLKEMGVSFRVAPMDIDESVQRGERAVDYVKRISQAKAMTARSVYPNMPLLAADTIVSAGARILRKAQNAQESTQQMMALSGRRHRVYTCVTLILPLDPVKIIRRLCVTHVAFKVLTPQEIQDFVASNEWRNVAVYRHEGHVRRFIRWMRGGGTTIQGLPFFETYHLLKGNGLI